jgi:hypothetical protein
MSMARQHEGEDAMTRDAGDTGPYGATSAQNTSTDWLSDFTPVKAKLAGMADYATALNDISMNLISHQTRLLGQMRQVLTAGAFSGGFPEVTYASVLHQQNMVEFSQYLQRLHDGIFHTANAAKAIADAYGDSDSFSAISLNTVQFAFGDLDAKRPAGMPASVQQTFSEQASNVPVGGDKGRPAPAWTSTGTVMNPDGGMTQTYIDQYGESRTITIAYDSSGHQITTTVDPTGKTVSDSSTYSYPLGTYTMTTTTDPKGHVSTSGSNSYGTGGNTSVTDDTTDGELKTETTVTTNANGSQTTTIYSYDKGKRTVDSQVTVGQDNPVNNGIPDSPADDAINQIRASMPQDPPPKNTTILAPGEPGVDYTGGGSTTA